MTISSAVATNAARVTFEPSGEYTLCLLDFSGVRDTESGLQVIAEARERIAQQPPFSLRVLTNVTGSHMSLPVIGALQELARANAPYVTKSAVYGLSLPHRVALRQLRRLTGRDVREFASREEALDYLRA